jgi:hypothetical protein
MPVPTWNLTDPSWRRDPFLVLLGATSICAVVRDQFCAAKTPNHRAQLWVRGVVLGALVGCQLCPHKRTSVGSGLSLKPAAEDPSPGCALMSLIRKPRRHAPRLSRHAQQRTQRPIWRLTASPQADALCQLRRFAAQSLCCRRALGITLMAEKTYAPFRVLQRSSNSRIQGKPKQGK